jgi:hypothetical protein
MSDAQPEPRIAVIIRSVAWVGVVAHAAFVPLFWLTGYPVLALFNVFSVPAWLLAWWVNRRGSSTLAMWLLAAEVVLHAVLAGMLLGWDTGFQYYLIPLIPFLMFNDRASLRVVHAASAVVIVVFLVLRALAPTDVVLPSELAWCRYANLVIPFGMLALLSHFFRLASIDVERKMTEMALTDPLTGLYNRPFQSHQRPSRPRHGCSSRRRCSVDRRPHPGSPGGGDAATTASRPAQGGCWSLRVQETSASPRKVLQNAVRS